MAPLTSRYFQKVAAQRLTTAEALLRERWDLDAQYIGGYTVECSLKALILHPTPVVATTATLKQLTSGAKMHRTDVLVGKLRDLGTALPLEIAKRCGGSIGQPTFVTKQGGGIQAKLSAS